MWKSNDTLPTGTWGTYLPIAAAVIALVVSLAPVPVAAHGGGLDDNGCHRNTSTGNYECHNGPHEGRSFDSRQDYPGSASSGSATQSNGGSPGKGQGGTDNAQVRSQSSDSQAYDRDDYHSRWLDRDDDCQDTREEVLIRQSERPVEFETDRECNVVSGRWRDPYSGETFTDPGDLHVDHLVPLAEAHRSGADQWSQQRKHTFANDLDTRRALIAVEAGQNMSKSDRGPSEWMPDNDAYHCDYVRRWVAVKKRWDLTMDPDERAFVRGKLDECGNNQSAN